MTVRPQKSSVIRYLEANPEKAKAVLKCLVFASNIRRPMIILISVALITVGALISCGSLGTFAGFGIPMIVTGVILATPDLLCMVLKPIFNWLDNIEIEDDTESYGIKPGIGIANIEQSDSSSNYSHRAETPVSKYKVSQARVDDSKKSNSLSYATVLSEEVYGTDIENDRSCSELLPVSNDEI